MSILINGNESKPTVTFLPFDCYDDAQRISAFEIIMGYRFFHLLNTFSKKELVGIKLSFGNGGEINNIPPDFISSLVNLIIRRGVDPVLCDTTYKYRDRYDNHYKHQNTISRKSCFSYDSSKVPFVMLDGISGNYEIEHEIHIDSKGSKSPAPSETARVSLAGDLRGLNGLIVCSRIVPHKRTGMEGAIKNIGFGLASRKGKIRQYSVSKPQVDYKKCVLCKRCINVCPTGAISLKDNIIVIDSETCVDCGKCVEYAYRGDISYRWDASPEHAQSTMALSALGVSSMFPNRIIYCNFLTQYSDPKNPDGEKKDIGILFSKDPVAIDKASLDIIKESHPQFLSQTVLSNVNYSVQLEYAERIGLGSCSYQLKTVAY